MRYIVKSFYDQQDGAASVEATILMAGIAAIATLLLVTILGAVTTFAGDLTYSALSVSPLTASDTSP